MKRIALGLLFVVLVSSSGFANGQQDASGESDGTVKLVFWDENGGAARTPIHEELLAVFMEENPGIEVEYVGIPWKSAKEKYQVAIVSDTTPDVAGTPTSWLSSFVVKEALLPLDSYFESWDEKDNIPALYTDLNRSQAPDGKLYQIPNSTNTSTIWYRTDRLADMGISTPESWADFFQAVKDSTTSDSKGLSIRGGAGSVNQFISVMYGYSGITEFFDAEGRCTMNDPKNVDFTEKFVALYGKYTPESDVTNGYKEMVAAFGSGSANMIIHNLGSYQSHKQNLGEGFSALSIFKSPFTENYNFRAPDPVGYSIYKNTKNADAAWDLVSFYGGAEAQSFFNKSIAQIPINTAVLSHEWLDSMDHIKTNMVAMSTEGATVWFPPSYLPDFSSILNNDLGPQFQKLLIGDITAQEFLDQASEKLEASKKEWDAATK